LDGKKRDLIHGSVQYLNLTQVRDQRCQVNRTKSRSALPCFR